MSLIDIMKKSIVIITVLVIFVSIFFFKGQAPHLQKSKERKLISKSPEVVAVKEKIIEDPEADLQNLHSIPKKQSDYQSDVVPWDELDKRWAEDLEEYVTGLDPVNGKKMINTFNAAKRLFNERSLEITKKQRKLILKQRTPFSEPIYKNKELYEELNHEWNNIHKKFSNQTKEIFREHYHQVKQYSRDYMHSVQGYSKDREVPIDLEPVFAD